jgi:hypothetical protein
LRLNAAFQRQAGETIAADKAYFNGKLSFDADAGRHSPNEVAGTAGAG